MKTFKEFLNESGFNVVLDDESVGKFQGSKEPKIGEVVTIELQDENGKKIKKKGTVKEVL